MIKINDTRSERLGKSIYYVVLKLLGLLAILFHETPKPEAC